MSVQESLVKAWVSGDLLHGGGTSAAMPAWGLLKEVAIVFITCTIIWPQVK